MGEKTAHENKKRIKTLSHVTSNKLHDKYHKTNATLYMYTTAQASILGIMYTLKYNFNLFGRRGGGLYYI